MSCLLSDIYIVFFFQFIKTNWKVIYPFCIDKVYTMQLTQASNECKQQRCVWIALKRIYYRCLSWMLFNRRRFEDTFKGIWLIPKSLKSRCCFYSSSVNWISFGDNIDFFAKDHITSFRSVWTTAGLKTIPFAAYIYPPKFLISNFLCDHHHYFCLR